MTSNESYNDSIKSNNDSIESYNNSIESNNDGNGYDDVGEEKYIKNKLIFEPFLVSAA
jgi:hypothetical protein